MSADCKTRLWSERRANYYHIKYHSRNSTHTQTLPCNVWKTMLIKNISAQDEIDTRWDANQLSKCDLLLDSFIHYIYNIWCRRYEEEEVILQYLGTYLFLNYIFALLILHEQHISETFLLVRPEWYIRRVIGFYKFIYNYNRLGATGLYLAF